MQPGLSVSEIRERPRHAATLSPGFAGAQCHCVRSRYGAPSDRPFADVSAAARKTASKRSRPFPRPPTGPFWRS